MDNSGVKIVELLNTKNCSSSEILVSVIIPSHNCEDFIVECLDSIKNQEVDISIPFRIEISICDDCSTDKSLETIMKWRDENIIAEINTKVSNGESCAKPDLTLIVSRKATVSKGAGFARNRAFEQSTGEYLCFCDADDILMPRRIAEQLKVAIKDGNRNALIGSKFVRQPENSTATFTHWINALNSEQLYTQIYLSFGPTLTMTTWFCHRSVFTNIGSFPETGTTFPEDLVFYYDHLDCGGQLIRLDETLMIYRYHPQNTTFSIPQKVIFDLRLERLQSHCLSKFTTFTIWNAGKLGRRLYRSLTPENQAKVTHFCDVDNKKISQEFYNPHPLKTRIPIIHFKDARPPFIICVKTELTRESDGPFMKNLESKSLVEGEDYYYFN